MTAPNHLVRFRVVFGEHVLARQLENMRPMLEAYSRNAQLFEESPRSFIVEAQREGGRKSLSKLLMDWEKLGFVQWEEIASD